MFDNPDKTLTPNPNSWLITTLFTFPGKYSVCPMFHLFLLFCWRKGVNFSSDPSPPPPFFLSLCLLYLLHLLLLLHLNLGSLLSTSPVVPGLVFFFFHFQYSLLCCFFFSPSLKYALLCPKNTSPQMHLPLWYQPDNHLTTSMSTSDPRQFALHLVTCCSWSFGRSLSNYLFVRSHHFGLPVESDPVDGTLPACFGHVFSYS